MNTFAIGENCDPRLAATAAPAPPWGQERRRWARSSTETEIRPPSPPALQPLRFSTRHLPPAGQLAAWRDYMAPVIDVRPSDGALEENGFPVDHVAWNLGGMLVVQQEVPPHSYERCAAKLRLSSIDHWSIGIPRVGRAWTEVDGHVAASRPGSVELRSLGLPFRGRTTASEGLVLYLPRDLFEDSAAALDASNNTILVGNLASLLIDWVHSIEVNLPLLSAEDLPRVVHATRDMLVACLSPSAEHGAAAQHHMGVALVERARQYIQHNLSSTDLTPDSLCRALGISRTHLYSLFEASGGVARYIQKRRLLASHAALATPTDRRRIADIAEAFGFGSAAEFSRAFSREFGYSPREAREAAVAAPTTVLHASHGPSPGNERSFEGWLKALGS